MHGEIPFIQSDTNYRLGVPIGDVMYLFDVRWNSRDEAHYLDIFEENGTPVALGIKLVLGVNLARRNLHPLLFRYVFSVIDTEQSGVDAAFDDLGRRVRLIMRDMRELARLNGSQELV
jgi:hypothetical protein